LKAWFGLLARLVLAGVWLAAGAAKVSDLAESVRAVHAYQILPYAASKVVGAALPFVEIALGLLLLAGFATRLAAGLTALMQAAFIAGIAAAWARGLRIDCGCFGGGGALGAGESPTYFWEIARDVGLVALAVYLLWRPSTRLAVDNLLSSGTDEDDVDAEE
jgi:uncharacterized membrane protein YphA (DoxX/SURF4 family)